jgi:hypothetical protein
MDSHVTWEYRLMIFKGPRHVDVYICIDICSLILSCHFPTLGLFQFHARPATAPASLYIHCFLYVPAIWVTVEWCHFFSACHCAQIQEIKWCPSVYFWGYSYFLSHPYNNMAAWFAFEATLPSLLHYIAFIFLVHVLLQQSITANFLFYRFSISQVPKGNVGSIKQVRY